MKISLDKKNLLIIAAFIITVIVVVFLLFFTNKKTSQDSSTGETNKVIEITSKITNISGVNIYLPKITSDGKKAIGLTDLGRFFTSIDLESNTTNKLIDEEILDPQKIEYSSDNSQAIVTSNYPGYNIKLYNFSKKTSQTLNSNIDQVVWSQKQNKIFYIYHDKDSFIWQFNVSNPDGSNWQKIYESNNAEIINISLSTDENQALVLTINQDETQEITNKAVLINITNKQSKELENIEIRKAFWSPDGKNILYYNYSNELGIYNFNTKENHLTGAQTDKEIIKWISNDKFIYYVPISDGTTNNDGYKIFLYDINSNETNELNIQNLGFVYQPDFIDYINGYLYFTNNNNLFNVEINIDKYLLDLKNNPLSE